MVNRNLLRVKEIPRLAKRERCSRTVRAVTTRDEYPSDQQAGRLGRKTVRKYLKCALQYGLRHAQARSDPVRSVSGKTDACRVWNASLVARDAREERPRWIYDSERLATTPADIGLEGKFGCRIHVHGWTRFSERTDLRISLPLLCHEARRDSPRTLRSDLLGSTRLQADSCRGIPKLLSTLFQSLSLRP